MPRAPRGKRVADSAGGFSVAAKNPNGHGSVYFEPPAIAADGRERPGRWRATYRDAAGRERKVSAPTRAKVEQRRDELLAEQASHTGPISGRFTKDSTTSELITWWLESVARPQVKASTYDSYRRFGSYLAGQIGAIPIVRVGAETLVTWQSEQLDRHAPLTVLNSRKVARQAFGEAVKLGLIPANPFDLVKPPPAKRVNPGHALSANDAKAMMRAAQSRRLGAAVTLLFCQGWRVSEVLGLAWEDLDLAAGTARIQRGAAYTPSVGMVLGATKTSGAEGIHYLAPASIAQLEQRRLEQNEDRERFPGDWPVHRYGGENLSMVFTTAAGRLVNRQSVVKAIEHAARAAGLDPQGLATHTGRRTVITALYADGGLDLADIARHVGHVDTSTTAGYVRSLGSRPRDTALRAAQLLDPTM